MARLAGGSHALGDRLGRSTALLQRQTLRRVRDFSATHPARICQPARHGHARHPVLLPKAVFQRIAGSTAATLKDFIAAQPRQAALCELEDPGLDLDIDRPEDYDKAVRYAAHGCWEER